MECVMMDFSQTWFMVLVTPTSISCICILSISQIQRSFKRTDKTYVTKFITGMMISTVCE